MKRLLHTALFAVLILAVGVSVLYGVRAVLPDYTQVMHTHSMAEGQLLPVFEQQKELILYPWKELTQTEPLPEDEYMEWLFYELSGTFGWGFSFIDLGKAELCYSKDGMSGGVRNVLAYTAQIEEHPMGTENELVSSVQTMALSAAFDGEVLCWFCVEYESGETSEKSLKEGYDKLCAQTQTLLLHFAEQYGTASKHIGAVGGIDTVNGLLRAEAPACYLYDGRTYIRYASDAGTLTLICDPITQTTVGFSLELR